MRSGRMLQQHRSRSMSNLPAPVMNMFKVALPLKEQYNSVIPLNIFQTWHTKSLSPQMYAAIQTLKNTNPKFSHHLYDDNDCRAFVQKYFGGEVLAAYNSLVPGAFRADLWRYCVLYIHGGIYLDIKYIPHNGFKFVQLTEQEHYCYDCNRSDIYNAIIVSKAGNPLLKQAIEMIVSNVKHRNYGSGPLDVSGPTMFARVVNKPENKWKIDLQHSFYQGNLNNRFIIYKGAHILRSYNGYLSEQRAPKDSNSYCELWARRQVYC